eukprot:scaffold201308_cov16-Tisochrysis_lutea.AAC.1
METLDIGDPDEGVETPLTVSELTCSTLWLWKGRCFFLWDSLEAPMPQAPPALLCQHFHSWWPFLQGFEHALCLIALKGSTTKPRNLDMSAHTNPFHLARLSMLQGNDG